MIDDADRRRRTASEVTAHRPSVQLEFAAEARQLAEISHRNERAERLRELRAAAENCAAEFDEGARTELDRLTGLLARAVAEPSRDVPFFRRAVPLDSEPGPQDAPSRPRPDWDEYAPPPPRMFGRRRFERDYEAARRNFDEAVRRYDRELADRFDVRVAERREAHEARWDARAEQITSADSEAIAEFVGTVLRASTALNGLVEGGRVSYESEPAELILEVDLPDTDIVPAARGWKYTIQKRTIDPIPLAREAANVYERLIAQMVLVVLDAVLRATPSLLVDTISINGHVRTTDRATGRPSRPCLVTASTERATFLELDLGHPKLDPKACLKKLGVQMSPHPYELTAIAPIVDFDLSKYRIAFGPEALAGLDHRTDLLKMNPYEFERLVKDLFAKMGYDTWRTESSRDDGIDAVATKSDPHMPVECIEAYSPAR